MNANIPNYEKKFLDELTSRQKLAHAVSKTLLEVQKFSDNESFLEFLEADKIIRQLSLMSIDFKMNASIATSFMLFMKFNLERHELIKHFNTASIENDNLKKIICAIAEVNKTNTIELVKKEPTKKSIDIKQDEEKIIITIT